MDISIHHRHHPYMNSQDLQEIVELCDVALDVLKKHDTYRQSGSPTPQRQ